MPDYWLIEELKLVMSTGLEKPDCNLVSTSCFDPEQVNLIIAQSLTQETLENGQYHVLLVSTSESEIKSQTENKPEDGAYGVWSHLEDL